MWPLCVPAVLVLCAGVTIVDISSWSLWRVHTRLFRSDFRVTICLRCCVCWPRGSLFSQDVPHGEGQQDQHGNVQQCYVFESGHECQDRVGVGWLCMCLGKFEFYSTTVVPSVATSYCKKLYKAMSCHSIHDTNSASPTASKFEKQCLTVSLKLLKGLITT